MLTSALVSSNCQDPVSLHDHSSDASCKVWRLSISEINSSVNSIRKKISYRKHVHHNPSSKYASRCWEKREWLHALWDNWNYFLKFVRIDRKAWKHSAEKYHDWTMKFTHSAVELIPFYPRVHSHHTLAVGN